MTAASNYLEDEVLDHVLGKGTRDFTSPANLYVSLHTADPTEAMDTGELSGNGYSRQSVTFGASSSGTASNTNQLTFSASGGSWGTVSHMGIFDAATVGNGLIYGSLTASRTVNDGDDLVFAVGDIDVSLD